MNLDPRTVVILTVLSTLFMSIGLFAVARGYLAEMRGVTRWASGTLLQSAGWILLALIGVVPAFISELGSPLIMLGLALYYHALYAFKGGTARVYWIYVVVGFNVLLIYYFLIFTPNMAARIVVASATAAILMFASARILLAWRISKLPVSHSMTGSLFAVCSLVLVVRAIYYLVWNTAPEQSAFEHNIVQDVAFLTFFLAGVVSPFTFILMCNDRYNANALLRTQELEEASRIKGQFLATMSHELRTPLNGVIGFLKQLGKTRLDEQQKDYLHTIDLSARMLLGVINDVLDFSKIEAGKLTIETIEIDLRDFMGEVTLMFAVQAGDKGLDLVCVIDSNVPSRLMGDPLRLTQVLANMLGNAIKFTEHGQVLLEVHLLKETDSEVSLQICVKDTGIGISQKSLERLFQPFVQADATTTRKHGGTGLGLIIARRLVEMMGGNIKVESEVWKGTKFSIQLNLAKQKHELENKQAKLEKFASGKFESLMDGMLAKPLLGKRTLIVDDNNINRKLVQLLVAEMGGDFDSAENGVQAVDACSRKAYDLILMDVNMPVMDGLEATKRIRALESGSRKTPIVALTANALPGDKERFIAGGMDDYLSKPINDKALLNILNKYFPQAPGQLPAHTLAEAGKEVRSSTTPALDPKMGVELSFGDANTWHMVLGMLLDELREYSGKLALAADDMQQLSYVAHKLAGSSCYCGTPALHQAAKQVEIHCTQADFHLVEGMLFHLQQQITHLIALDAAGKLRRSEVVVYCPSQG